MPQKRSLHKGKIEVVDLGGVKVKRVILNRDGAGRSVCIDFGDALFAKQQS